MFINFSEKKKIVNYGDRRMREDQLSSVSVSPFFCFVQCVEKNCLWHLFVRNFFYDILGGFPGWEKVKSEIIQLYLGT